ncbi:hypothetical protein ACHAXS_000354 [Conticribra weissflogii]
MQRRHRPPHGSVEGPSCLGRGDDATHAAQFRAMRVLQSIHDREGNMLLYLCCANLDYLPQWHNNTGGPNNLEDHCLAVLQEIAKAAPSNAWTMQNLEGDTPLHMLITSPLFAADPNITNVWHLSQLHPRSTAHSTKDIASATKIAMAMLHIALALDAPPSTVNSNANANSHADPHAPHVEATLIHK